MKERPRQDDLHIIVRLKVRLALLSLAFAFAICQVAASVDFSSWMKPLPFLRYVPWSAVADACLTTFLLALIYEGWIRRETLKEFHQTILSPRVVRGYLSKAAVIALLETGFQRILGDDTFGSQIFSYFMDTAFNPQQRRYDAHVTVMLLPLGVDSRHLYTRDQSVHYFNARMIYSYKREIHEDSLEFRCYTDFDDYVRSYRDSRIEFRWQTPPMRLFSTFTPDFFEVTECRIDGDIQVVRTRLNPTDGSLTGYYVKTGARRKSGVLSTIEYVVDVKIQRFSHCMVVGTREPTLGYKLSFDFTDVDISYVTAYPSYASPKSPDVRYLPNHENPSRIEIELDAWCIPDSATMFAWVLKQETEPAYRTEIADPRSQRLVRSELGRG